MDQTDDKQAHFLPSLLLGILSIVFAEVFSGSSPLWFLDPFTIILAFFLYLGHILYLLNLALKYSRTSMTHLYLWGIIFGLYESWITKVVWAGYMEEPGPAWGTFLGFAVVEFMIIGLFWHAIFSFVFPLLVYEIIVISTSTASEVTLLNNHSRFLLKTRKNTVLFYLLFIVGSLLMLLGLEANTMKYIKCFLKNFHSK
jgi:hypothetical protein